MTTCTVPYFDNRFPLVDSKDVVLRQTRDLAPIAEVGLAQRQVRRCSLSTSPPWPSFLDLQVFTARRLLAHPYTHYMLQPQMLHEEPRSLPKLARRVSHFTNFAAFPSHILVVVQPSMPLLTYIEVIAAG
jgi:hypothetical protein